MWERKASYVKHEPCPSCGSKDNLARYSDGGGYCFGCGYQERGKRYGAASKPSEEGRRVSIPSDSGTYYGNKVIEWLSKYEIGVEDLIRNNVVWSPSREQLIYQFYGEDNELVLWQARNFRDGTDHKHRFFTCGSANDVIARYVGSEVQSTSGGTGSLVDRESSKSTAVVVEDCVSAMKVAKAGYDGLPCLGSHMSKRKLSWLARLYSQVDVWLDYDKFREGGGLSTQLQLLGVDSKIIVTDKDPKEINLNDIRRLVELVSTDT